MVDILMATYNGEKYISEQIESILKQDYKKWKLYIRDDGSTDNTIKILKEYQKKYSDIITILEDNKGNLGAKLCFSELMKYSTSPYCMFCDQDDVWLSNKISITLSAMKDIEEIKGFRTPILVHTDLKVVDDKLSIIHPSIWEYVNLDPSRNKLNKLLVKATVTGCTMMINKTLKELAQDIPNETLMHDYWISLVASACGYIKYVENSTILYRQHGNNQVGSGKKSIFEKINKALKSKRYDLNILESKVLYKRYNKLMSPKNIKILRDFIRIEESSFIGKRIILIKHNYFTNNKFRNIQMLLFC